MPVSQSRTPRRAPTPGRAVTARSLPNGTDVVDDASCRGTLCNVTDHAEVQNIAREAMDATRVALRPGQSLREVRERCEATLIALGADSFWYWGIGAFVFAGAETVRSVSGRTYQTADHVLGENELITLDLSPQRAGVWGLRSDLGAGGWPPTG